MEASPTSALCFITLSISYTLWLKRKKQTVSDQLTKDEVLTLRKRHYSNCVSISYENSDPLMIMSGYGSRLVDEKGISYLDTRNNVAHVGHQNPQVVKAVQRQVATLNTNSRYLHPNSVLLAQRLTKLLPEGLEKVFFVNSGSEANDLALRLARAYSKSKNCIVVDHAYHGHTLATLEVSPYKFDHSKEFELDGSAIKCPGKHIFKVPCPDTFRGLHRGENAGEEYAKYVIESCEAIQNRGEKVSAFIIEGGLSVGGVIMPPKNYLRRSVEAVRKAGGLYIADEVQTSFGRLGKYYWAFEYGDSGVIPDIVTIGKPFGNGMPLAAVVTTKHCADVFESMGVEYFNTFGGNPVSTAAGLAVLEYVQSYKLEQQADRIGTYLKDQLLKIGQRFGKIGDVRGSGLFLGVEFVKDMDSLEPAPLETSFICSTLKEHYKILTSIDGPYENVLVIKPPMVFNKNDANEFLSAVSCTLEKLETLDVTSFSKTPT